jgi:hypothetical protein
VGVPGRLLERQPGKGHHTLVVLATMSTTMAREARMLTDAFDVVLEVPPLSARDDVGAVLAQAGGVAAEDMDLAMLALAPELPIGMRRLLKGLNTARPLHVEWPCGSW